MNAKPLKLLCLFSAILGNRILSNRLEEVLTDMPDVDPQFIYITNKDYHTAQAPKWCRLSNSFETEYVTKYVLDNANIKEYDAIFINGIEHCLPLSNAVKKFPSVIGCDATVNLSQAQMRVFKRGFISKIKSSLAQKLMNHRYKRIFKDNNIFLPMSEWAKNDLVRSYSANPDDCYVSYVPIDFLKWGNPIRTFAGMPRILFVGNDFVRKGGDLLLEIHQESLKDKAELIIISNDPSIKDAKYPNVRFLRNIEHSQIKDNFLNADLFVFPTKKEYLGVVITEAMASGLPVIARDTGAINEFIINDQTGVLMPYESQKEEWRDAIVSLINDPARMHRYSQNARRKAEELFSIDIFKEKIREIVDKLRAKA